MHVQQGLQGENCVAHHTLEDHFGLSPAEVGVLCADVALGRWGGFEGHGAGGALVEDLAMSCLDVGLDGIQAPKHNLATRAPVSNASGEVQTGLLQVGLEAGLSGGAATLRTDVRGFVFVDPLVSGESARVWQHHRRRALRTCRVRSRPDLLKVRDQLRLVVALRLALRTFEVVVLQPLCLLTGQGHERLRTLSCPSNLARLS